MCFVTLKLFKRAYVWIGIAEVGDQANGYLVIFQMVQKATTGRAAFCQGPTGRMHDEPWFVFVARDFPDFLDADAIMLWVFVSIQFEAGNQLFAQMPTATLGKQSVFAMQFHTRCEACCVFTVMPNTHVAGNNTFH